MLAVWSPDGEKIAYTSMQDGNAEIYMGVDLSGPPGLPLDQAKMTSGPNVLGFIVL